ncbi:helix-turn-helix domain-containing protein [Euzebyella marina]|uniref:Helix-turn-helix domain-containing protein n=2 Tax=Euzebyella marina TaxID=1761453 RepID=A0A3G2LBT5_9FLAO|nr:helix-turn-helix domain-containing protein [Euzebyella marina]
MQDRPTGHLFTEQAKAILLENLENENFGVSELADAMHMSRSNLLRKCKKQTQLSASQFIRKIRLEQAMDILKESPELTVSEVSYRVGFGSSSYFIKCFREEYGYPPGEVAKMNHEENVATDGDVEASATSILKKYRWAFLSGAAAVLLLILLVVVFLPSKKNTTHTEAGELEKSIAVLPFRNESNDSTNLYFVNGLMEASLGNLQKIEALRVISRTSVEKYRHSDQNIAEIAHELGVNYVVEGSGQKIGDQVLLNIQLIDAATDTPVWGQRYTHEVVDIFALQNEVAKKIADAIKASVTPSELEQIDKKPTDNLVAYDYYLQAQEPFLQRTTEGLMKAIPLFEKALEEDPEFALVYADLAVTYYYLDLFKKEKQFTEEINKNADKALLYDSKLTESLVAKALYYMHTGDYRLAVPHLLKAMEYNPNSSAVVQLLSDLYANYIPDTGKYLEYALKGRQLEVAANDSVSQSYLYLHLGNALIQAGFTDEAITYINKSLAYNPQNYYAPYAKAYIMYAKDGNLKNTLVAIKNELKKDINRLDILQETGRLYYFLKQYDSAYVHYKRFDSIRKVRNLNIYPHEDIKIAFVYEKMGFEAESERLMNAYTTYCENDQSIYQPASMAVKLAYEGHADQAIEELKKFATKDHFQYWAVLFMRKDPCLAPLQSHPEFEPVMQKIENRFWSNHEDLKKNLESKNLL